MRLLIGSPPRAWGQWYRPRRRVVWRRFTPTGVGTMTPSPTPTVPPPVHPHGRGDNSPTRHARTVRHGSPPRAWGQSEEEERTWRRRRFTPTGVGTIGHTNSAATGRPVHPHGRGDNDGLPAVFDRKIGSPPRAWGQCCGTITSRACWRFTPTGVGTMPFASKNFDFPSVHPHGRGDNRSEAPSGNGWGGSPPRAWGQLGRV